MKNTWCSIWSHRCPGILKLFIGSSVVSRRLWIGLPLENSISEPLGASWPIKNEQKHVSFPKKRLKNSILLFNWMNKKLNSMGFLTWKSSWKKKLFRWDSTSSCPRPSWTPQRRASKWWSRNCGRPEGGVLHPWHVGNVVKTKIRNNNINLSQLMLLESKSKKKFWSIAIPIWNSFGICVLLEFRESRKMKHQTSRVPRLKYALHGNRFILQNSMDLFQRRVTKWLYWSLL